MCIRDALTNVLYFTVGAVAVGLEAVAEVADELTQKGANVVKEGKAVFADTCAKFTACKKEETAPIEEDMVLPET